jgi:hypothetical protein
VDGVLADILKASENEREKSLSAWRWQLRGHYVFGVAAVVAGAVAGFAALAKSAPAVTATAGFAAAVAAGLQSFLKAEEKARYHRRQAGEYAAVARSAKRLIEMGVHADDPAVAELSDRLHILTLSTFGGDEPASSRTE